MNSRVHFCVFCFAPFASGAALADALFESDVTVAGSFAFVGFTIGGPLPFFATFFNLESSAENIPLESKLFLR